MARVGYVKYFHSLSNRDNLVKQHMQLKERLENIASNVGHGPFKNYDSLEEEENGFLGKLADRLPVVQRIFSNAAKLYLYLKKNTQSKKQFWITMGGGVIVGAH